jgi:hypothetical protein
MRFDADHPLNALFVASQQGKGAGTADVLEPWDAKPSAWDKRGSPPGVVQHLWKKLGNKLPVNCRAILYGSPVLIEPSSGVVIAKAYGTVYVIRVCPGDIEAALSLGCTTTHQWSDGTTLDLQQELGVDWVFGHFLKEEYGWLQNTFTMVAVESS